MLREHGGDCLKYVKSGWNRKEGRGNKDLKNGGGGGKLGQGVDALKRGLEPPCELWVKVVTSLQT